jgi:hypothetical protein
MHTYRKPNSLQASSLLFAFFGKHRVLGYTPIYLRAPHDLLYALVYRAPVPLLAGFLFPVLQTKSLSFPSSSKHSDGVDRPTFVAESFLDFWVLGRVLKRCRISFPVVLLRWGRRSALHGIRTGHILSSSFHFLIRCLYTMMEGYLMRTSWLDWIEWI